MGGGRHSLSFYDVISVENLLAAWREYRKGKRSKKDVAEFELNLEDNLFQLHGKLLNGEWKTDPYVRKIISDPKPRVIHIASIRDRVLFQAIYRKLYPIFDTRFIFDSYSSRNRRGTHKGFLRFAALGKKITGNHYRIVYCLKCDVRKFFDSVHHNTLLSFIAESVNDPKLLGLIDGIVRSFKKSPGRGLPLGNVTSQLFANIYLNELDQFIKHKLKVKYYIRYADDFVILSEDKIWLHAILPKIAEFLERGLRLALHPDKVFIKTFASGVDFLGWVHFRNHRVLRTQTKRRMLKRVAETRKKETVASYLDLLKHGNAEKLKRRICDIIAT